jgi:hypothetical protein
MRPPVVLNTTCSALVKNIARYCCVVILVWTLLLLLLLCCLCGM